MVVARIGRSGQGSDLEGVDSADIYIGLKPKGKCQIPKMDLIEAMAKDLTNVPGLKFSFSQPIADMIDDLVSGVG